MDAVTTVEGKVSVLDRADIDTDQIIPKQFLKRIERTGFGEFLFYDWAKQPGWDLPANPILATGPELRLRLVARARPVGAAGLRLPRGRRGELRRHLLLQLHEDRAAARAPRRRRRARGDGGGGGGDRPRGARGARQRAHVRRSSSTTTRGTGCSTGSTTSRSPSSRTRRSPPTSPTASARPRHDEPVAASGARGSRNQNVPEPRRWTLSTPISPACASTIRFASASPRPVPPIVCVSEESTRWNMPKMAARARSVLAGRRSPCRRPRPSRARRRSLHAHRHRAAHRGAG